MGSIEKKMLIAMGFMVLFILGGLTYVSSLIQEAGGVKAMVIEAGKEMKEISAEIDKHEPTKG